MPLQLSGSSNIPSDDLSFLLFTSPQILALSDGPLAFQFCVSFSHFLYILKCIYGNGSPPPPSKCSILVCPVYSLYALSCVSHVQLFAIPCTGALQAPLSMGFYRQQYWSGLPCPPPGDLPGPGTEPTCLMSPALAGWYFTTSSTYRRSK